MRALVSPPRFIQGVNVKLSKAPSVRDNSIPTVLVTGSPRQFQGIKTGELETVDPKTGRSKIRESELGFQKLRVPVWFVSLCIQVRS